MTKETITEWFSVQDMLPPNNEFVLLRRFMIPCRLVLGERDDWWGTMGYAAVMQPTDMWAFLDDEEEMEDG